LPYFMHMETKDRIKQIMEEQHMTQQMFADFLQQAPATLSSIFNGRTRPTLNIVDAIKTKIPDISIEWLLYGMGEMYISHPKTEESPLDGSGISRDLMLDFDSPMNSGSQNSHQNVSSAVNVQQGVKSTQSLSAHDEIREVRVIEKDPRRVTEIRVYYDDQTYETFVPAKK